MTDDLRDKIAAALESTYGKAQSWHDQADAVIAALQPELTAARYHKEYCRR